MFCASRRLEEASDEVKKEVPWPYQLPLQKVTDFAGRHLGYGAALDAMMARFQGAGGTLSGVGEYLKEQKPSVKTVRPCLARAHGQLLLGQRTARRDLRQGRLNARSQAHLP